MSGVPTSGGPANMHPRGQPNFQGAIRGSMPATPGSKRAQDARSQMAGGPNKWYF